MIPQPAPKKPHMAGILAALVSVAGIVTSPAVSNLLPATWAGALTAAGIVLQAVTKGVQHGGTDLVPKDDITTLSRS